MIVFKVQVAAKGKFVELRRRDQSSAVWIESDLVLGDGVYKRTNEAVEAIEERRDSAVFAQNDRMEEKNNMSLSVE